MAVQLEYENSLMQFEKEIMGERLTGFYRSLDHILGTCGFSAKLSEEIKIISSEATKYIHTVNELNKSLADISHDRDTMMRDHLEMSDIKSDLISQRDKMTKAFKDRYASMQKELSTSIEDREIFKNKLEEMEKKYVDISEEFKRFRHKTKLRISSVKESEEKFCKNCQKSYFENDNFNWSCRVHASKISGDTYWCCGKIGKDAVGCLVSKHLNKEEEDAKDDIGAAPSKFCSACKDYGHCLADCYRDPNAKTGFDLEEERKRLKDTNRNKRKAAQSLDIQFKVSSMLSGRSLMLQESFDNFNEDDNILFDDLKELREEIEFEPKETKVKIEFEGQKPTGKPNRSIEPKKRTLIKPPSIFTKLEIDD